MKKAIGIVMVVMAVMVLGASPAMARTTTSSGCAGATTTGRAIGYWVNFYGIGSMITLGADVAVGRSSCYSGAQKVEVIYRKWGYNTPLGWVNYHRPVYSVVLQPWHTQGNFALQPFNGGEYRDVSLDVTIRWRNASTGTILGEKYVNYNTVSDYECRTGSTACYRASDPTMGAYIHLW